MNILIKNLFITFVALGLVACSKENVTEAPHASKLESSSVQNQFTPSIISKEDQRSLDNTQISSIENASIEDLYKNETRLQSVINQNYIYQFQNTTKMKEVLNNYNETILELIKKGQGETSKLKQILKNYQDLLFTDCINGLGNCTNLSFFNKDYVNTTAILLYILKDLDKSIEANKLKKTSYANELNRFYLLLDTISELRNSNSIELADALYLKYSFEYAKLLSEGKQKEKLEDHGNLFVTKIKAFSYDSKKQEINNHIKNTIDQFHPCEYTQNNSHKYFQYGSAELLGLSSKVNQSALLKCFEDRAKSQEENKSNQNNFMTLVDKIETDKGHKEIIRSMGMESTSSVLKSNLSLVFIIDNLYNSNWTEEETQKLTSELKINPENLLKVLGAYIKYRLIDNIIETNIKMHDIYNNGKNITSKNIFNKAIVENISVINLWKDLTARLSTLKNFSSYIINQNGNSTFFDLHNDLFDNINKNIKYLAGVPHMLLLTYKMAQLEGTITLPGLLKTVNLDTQEVIQQFFSGAFPIWFNFTNDQMPLNKMEIIYAFDFALKTRIFNNFEKASKNKKNVSPEDFFKVVISKYLAGLKNQMMKLLDETEALNKEDMRHFFKICSGNDYNHPLPLSDISARTLLGNVPVLSKFHSSFANSIKNIRENVLSDLTYVQNLIDVYQAHYPDSKSSIDREVNLLKSNLVTIYKNILAFETNTSNCHFKLIAMEYKQQQLLFEKEKKHIKNIFEAMIALEKKTPEEQSTDIQKYNLELNNNNLINILKKEVDPDKELFDKITPNYYYYSTLGFLGRIVNNLKEINPNINVDVPTFITMSDLYQTDKKNIIHGTYLPTEGSDEQRLEVFTRNILKKMFAGNTSFANWFTNSDSMKMDFVYNKLLLQIELLKASRHSLFSDNDASICAGVLSNLPKDTCLKKIKQTPYKLIKSTLEVAKLLSITDKDIEILKLLDIDTKHVQTIQDSLFFKSRTEPLTILEKIYEELNQNTVALKDASAFHTDIIKTEHKLLFMPSEFIKPKLVERYSPLVKNSFQLVDDFIKAVHEIEQRHTERDDDSQALLRYVYKIDLNGDDHLFISTLNNHNIVYLSEDKIENNTKFIETYHKETNRCFDPTNLEGCLKTAKKGNLK